MKIYESSSDPTAGGDYGSTRWTVTSILNDVTDINPDGIQTTEEITTLIWNGILECINEYKKGWHPPRIPCFDEFNAMWYREPIVSRFDERGGRGHWYYNHDCVKILEDVQHEVKKLYASTFNKKLTREILNFSLMCAKYREDYLEFCSEHDVWNSLDPKDKWGGEVYKDEIIEMIETKKKVGSCLMCGEDIYALDPILLDDAGYLNLNFGYGSHRDLDYGVGYIHDVCSFKLDQEVFGRRLFWQNPISGGVYPLKNLDTATNDPATWEFDEGKFNSSDPHRAFRATGDDLADSMWDEVDFDDSDAREILNAIKATDELVEDGALLPGGELDDLIEDED